MSAFVELFGPELRGQDGSVVSTEQATADNTAIGIYFSAHWCGPCRGFTPVLAESYKAMREAGIKFEIVFVSSDRDEASFMEYHAEMPWLAVPFARRDIKAVLSKKYKVQGIPSFVILDPNGKTITLDGREAISEDPTGQQFPWYPPSFAESIGDEFVAGDGSIVSWGDITSKNTAIGIYFSAHWCPPCRIFTPQLVSTYQKLKAANKGFEVIFVSSDRDQGSFKEYFAEMPWLAAPFADRARKEKLSKFFNVEGIPSFVILDSNGNIINDSGRACIANDPEGLEFPWFPKPVNPVSAPEGINETPSLILYIENAPAEVKKGLGEAFTDFANRVISSSGAAKPTDAPLMFFVSETKSGLGDRLASLTGINNSSTDPILVLIDIPDEGGFYRYEHPVTDKSFEEFWLAYQNKALKRNQLKN